MLQSTPADGPPVTMARDDFKHFCEALKKESPESLEIVESTYFRWRAGDVPKIIRTLLALLRDASERKSADE